ncbi:MAG: polysaccharide deacetylase family protein [Armatimonadota bacterium]
MQQHRAEQAQGISLRKFIRGDRTRRWIALTFDDGPHPEYTPKIVQILERYKVRATFFVVGKMAEKYPELIRLHQKAGNEIGNHTYDHVNLTRLSRDQIAAEIERCGEVIRAITGQTPYLFRPPGGDYNRTVAEVAASLGYWMVLWTDDPGDYANPPEKVLQERLFSKISNGGIILLHDGVPETIDLLPKLIERLKAEGYEIVPVGEMIRASNNHRSTPTPHRLR